jgi:hypothetical protein
MKKITPTVIAISGGIRNKIATIIGRKASLRTLWLRSY